MFDENSLLYSQVINIPVCEYDVYLNFVAEAFVNVLTEKAYVCNCSLIWV